MLLAGIVGMMSRQSPQMIVSSIGCPRFTGWIIEADVLHHLAHGEQLQPAILADDF